MASELELLRSFVTVYRAGSITRGAPRLGLTQPAVSAHVRDLETRVGRPLFTRSPRGSVPTQAAHDLARRVAPHIDALAGVVDSGAGDPLEGSVLHVGGPAEFLAVKALPVLAGLVDRGVRLRVRHDLPGPLVEDLAGGSPDVVIATRRVDHRAIEYETLYLEEFVLVGAPRWAAEASRGRRGGPDPGAVARMPLIAYSEELPVTARAFEEALGAASPEPAVLVPDLRGVAALACAGAGVAALPRYLCETALDRGELVELARPASPTRSPIHAAWRRGESAATVHAALHVLRAAARAW
ncbi:MAG: LysR family transcriptional regulator [Thermoleophilia bacterium]|nr:LysR family transcriptional regulator [Thermoleophilia bacterium]